MKKFALVTLTILALLFSMLPMSSVLAKKDPTNVKLQVSNRTGGTVSLNLVDENGNSIWFEYGPGQTNTPLSEGKYTFYASTPCGNRSGVFNVNVTKQLFFSCGDSVEVSLRIPSHNKQQQQSCYGIYDYWDFTDWEWDYMGEHCQDSPAFEYQQIVYDVPDPSGTFSADAWFFNSGADACAPEYGSAYYYDDCWWGD